MTTHAAEYTFGDATSRATALSIIIAAHVLGVAAIISMGGISVVVKAVPLLVSLVPDPPVARPPLPTRTVPLPEMRPPDIKLPTPPPLENLYMVKVEERPTVPVLEKTPVAVSEKPEPVVTAEPPRFDMAYLNNPAPSYPSLSRRSREQGQVMLRVRVDPAGRVESIEVHKTSGFPRLDDAALAAVRRWKFQPARQGTQAIAGWALVPIHFQLEG
ncbi:hypothetical protein BWI17_16135 [Betaproteobacteria bacterium GR16-43]|nr:hypothetical protein BWI17_16135 [Betaproteobacteria bacterium GR16-43]